MLVAAPAYLKRQGTPRAVQDLAAHRHIVFRLPSSGRERPQQFTVGGQVLALQPAEGLRLNDGEAMVQAAVLGLGLAQVPDVMAAEEIACRPSGGSHAQVPPAGHGHLCGDAGQAHGAGARAGFSGGTGCTCRPRKWRDRTKEGEPSRPQCDRRLMT